MHALIIEDEGLVALSIEDVLRNCGFTSFDFAASPAEAFQSVRCRCPSLITADVQLRPGCGVETVAIIRENQPIPVIFVTGNPNEVLVRAPGHPVVTKPVSNDHVKEAVALVLP